MTGTPRLALGVPVLVAFALALAGCGASQATGGRVVASENGPAKVDADGKLPTDPPFLSVADLGHYPRSDPRSTVLELWFWQQWGSTDSALALYQPGVRARTGAALMRRGLTRASTLDLHARMRFLGVRRRGRFARVTVEAFNSRPGRMDTIYWLARQGGRWRLIFDRDLAAGIFYSVYERQRKGGGSVVVSSREPLARVEAARAVRRFQAAAVATGRALVTSGRGRGRARSPLPGLGSPGLGAPARPAGRAGP